MANGSKSLQKYYGLVAQANLDLSRRWGQITGHLRYGVALPVVTSAILYKSFQPPTHYMGSDGKMHRKPLRALYGFGHSAKEHFDSDTAAYAAYADALRNQIEHDNAAVVHWVNQAQVADREGMSWYCNSVLPSALPQIPGTATTYLFTGYSATERHLVLQRYVPDLVVVPDLDRYEVGRNLAPRTIEVSDQNRRLWYLSLLSQIALLTVDRVYRSEIAGVVDVATVNGVTVMRNPATGHDEVTFVLSVSIPKQRFLNLNLVGVDPVSCILDFNARLTPHPGEYSPLTPWVNVDHNDVVVTVNDTPVLTMDPGDFEELVTELLRRMGLRAQTTGRTGDGGVDCEAYDDRPMVGGKVIVQVKRYTNTVPPTMVRDLYGTVHASGATKGVLVTTSGFGPESREFAQGKPLELIDGVQLDVLLRQYGLAGTPSEGAPSANELREAAPLVSPDGQYYWDGVAWQLIANVQSPTTTPSG
jgi:restriction system protein